MITSIAAIRAARCGAQAAVLAAPPPPPDALGEWVAAVASAAITRTPRADGGYELHAGRRRVVVVTGGRPDGLFTVTNMPAGNVTSRPLPHHQAHSLALRIARLEALT